MTVARCIEVILAIPDNEARTALATLQRLGIAAGGLERADLYRCDVEADQAERLVATLRSLETVFNPNKHDMRVRSGDAPAAGEVWVEEVASTAPSQTAGAPVRVGGRTLPGVKEMRRATAWRLFDGAGAPAGEALVRAAAETLLCNPAFQKATRHDDRT